MHTRIRNITGLAIPVVALAFASPLRASGNCDLASLGDQHRDVVTVQRLEKQWNIAYIKGDTTLERCILTSDFAEIMATGDVKGLADELGLAAKNIGKNLAMPDFKPATVLIHGNVAVAYGTSGSSNTSGEQRAMRYADYYVWEDGRWHAYFAQQTRFSVTRPVANVTARRPS